MGELGSEELMEVTELSGEILSLVAEGVSIKQEELGPRGQKLDEIVHEEREMFSGGPSFALGTVTDGGWI